VFQHRHDYGMEERLRERVRAEPHADEAHRELAAWLTRAGCLAQAREALQAGQATAKGTASLRHLLALIFAGAGEYASAERHLARAAAQEPARFEYARDLGLVQAAGGRTAESVESLRQAIALAPEPPVDLACLVRIGEQALARSGEGVTRRPPRPRRRAAVIENLVTRNPEAAEALVASSGEADADRRETLRAARRALRRLIERNPSYPDLHFGLSLIAEQLGELDRAIEAAEKALALNPRYVQACLLAVRLYEKQGNPVRATEHCRQVTELEPRWLDAHLRLGHLLREQGLVRDAASAYRRALEVDGRCEEARHRLENLEAALVADPPTPRLWRANGGDR